MFDRGSRLFVSALALLLVTTSCSSGGSGETTSESSAIIDDSPLTPSTSTVTASQPELGDTDPALGSTEATIYSSYEEWSDHELAALVPSPQELGPGWDNFELELISEAPLFDPAEEEPGDDCGLTQPVVIRQGFYAEHGYNGNVDDAAVVLSRGTSEELTAFFDGLQTLFGCPVQGEGLGTVLKVKTAPDLPGVIEAYRYESDDDIGQHSEGLLVRRADLVYFLDVFTQEGAQQVDIDILAAQMLSAYDGT